MIQHGPDPAPNEGSARGWTFLGPSPPNDQSVNALPGTTCVSDRSPDRMLRSGDRTTQQHAYKQSRSACPWTTVSEAGFPGVLMVGPLSSFAFSCRFDLSCRLNGSVVCVLRAPVRARPQRATHDPFFTLQYFVLLVQPLFQWPRQPNGGDGLLWQL